MKKRINLKIPRSYFPGIEYIESLTLEATIGWLEDEVRGRQYMLSGDEMSQPQALIEHYKYLSEQSKLKVKRAIEFLIRSWCKKRLRLSTRATYNLLSVTGQLHVMRAMPLLKRKAESKGRIRPRSVRGFILGAIANNLVKGDDTARAFWERIAKMHPEYAGMAFQALSRIDTESALLLLERFPGNKSSVGSVARAVGDFILAQSKKEGGGY
jgi:hypothetical protein